jgi:hypothetical protein
VGHDDVWSFKNRGSAALSTQSTGDIVQVTKKGQVKEACGMGTPSDDRMSGPV